MQSMSTEHKSLYYLSHFSCSHFYLILSSVWSWRCAPKCDRDPHPASKWFTVTGHPRPSLCHLGGQQYSDFKQCRYLWWLCFLGAVQVPFLSSSGVFQTLQLHLSGKTHTCTYTPHNCEYYNGSCDLSLGSSSTYPRIIPPEGRRESAAYIGNPQTSRECKEQSWVLWSAHAFL